MSKFLTDHAMLPSNWIGGGKRFSCTSRAGSPSLLACLPRAPRSFLRHIYFHAPATQRAKIRVEKRRRSKSLPRAQPLFVSSRVTRQITAAWETTKRSAPAFLVARRSFSKNQVYISNEWLSKLSIDDSEHLNNVFECRMAPVLQIKWDQGWEQQILLR